MWRTTNSRVTLSLSVRLCLCLPPFLDSKTQAASEQAQPRINTSLDGYIGHVLSPFSTGCTGTPNKAHISAVKYHGERKPFLTTTQEGTTHGVRALLNQPSLRYLPAAASTQMQFMGHQNENQDAVGQLSFSM